MFKFWLRSPLFDQAGEGAGGSGGSGAGAGNSGAVDLAAFVAEVKGVLADYRKDINSVMKSTKEIAAKFQGSQGGQGGSGSGNGEGSGSGSGSGQGSGSGEGGGEGSGSGSGKAADPALAAQIRALERRLKESDDRQAAMKAESDKTKADADLKDLNSNLRTKLAGKFKFADEQALQDAFDIFSPKIKRNEEGAIVGHDGTPLEQYLEESMRSKQYLLAPKDAGGAGARNGGRPPGAQPFDINNIKPGMKPEDRALALQEIARASVEASAGR